MAGVPLTRLNLFETGVSDLLPLEDCPLEELHIAATNVTSRAALRGVRLKTRVLNDTLVMALGPSEGMPLEVLEFGQGTLQPYLRASLQRAISKVCGA
jgi:hypothetical protein